MRAFLLVAPFAEARPRSLATERYSLLVSRKRSAAKR